MLEFSSVHVNQPGQALEFDSIKVVTFIESNDELILEIIANWLRLELFDGLFIFTSGLSQNFNEGLIRMCRTSNAKIFDITPSFATQPSLSPYQAVRNLFKRGETTERDFLFFLSPFQIPSYGMTDELRKLLLNIPPRSVLKLPKIIVSSHSLLAETEDGGYARDLASVGIPAQILEDSAQFKFELLDTTGLLNEMTFPFFILVNRYIIDFRFFLTNNCDLGVEHRPRGSFHRSALEHSGSSFDLSKQLRDVLVNENICRPCGYHKI
jgi:hypothetical protein